MSFSLSLICICISQPKCLVWCVCVEEYAHASVNCIATWLVLKFWATMSSYMLCMRARTIMCMKICWKGQTNIQLTLNNVVQLNCKMLFIIVSHNVTMCNGFHTDILYIYSLQRGSISACCSMKCGTALLNCYIHLVLIQQIWCRFNLHVSRWIVQCIFLTILAYLGWWSNVESNKKAKKSK